MIRSQLDFPLDPFRIAVGWSGEREDGGGGAALRSLAEAWISAGPAFFRMRDRDWLGVNSSRTTSNTNVLLKFSDTYSETGTLLFGGQVERELTTGSFLGEPFAIGLGAGAWRYAYDITGLSGEQLSEDGTGWTHVSAPDDLLVGTYESWSAHSTLGFRTLEPILGLDWNARLHPLTYASATDDHILRKKRIEMDCIGTGGSLEASRPWGTHWLPYARFELERSWGRMKQTYYADSPDTPEDETGQSFNGIHTTVNAWLFSLGIRWSWR